MFEWWNKLFQNSQTLIEFDHCNFAVKYSMRGISLCKALYSTPLQNILSFSREIQKNQLKIPKKKSHKVPFIKFWKIENKYLAVDINPKVGQNPNTDHVHECKKSVLLIHRSLFLQFFSVEKCSRTWEVIILFLNCCE